MKYLKLYEEEVWETNYALGKKIEKVCEPWKEVLNIQEFQIYPNQMKIHMKIYYEMNELTYNNFHELFTMLMNLKIWWKYTSRDLVLGFSHLDQDELNENLDMILDAKKYNL